MSVPAQLTFTVPDCAEKELQCMAVIAQVMEHFIKPRENLADITAQMRVADWVHSRYGFTKNDL